MNDESHYGAPVYLTNEGAGHSSYGFGDYGISMDARDNAVKWVKANAEKIFALPNNYLYVTVGENVEWAKNYRTGGNVPPFTVILLTDDKGRQPDPAPAAGPDSAEYVQIVELLSSQGTELTRDEAAGIITGLRAASGESASGAGTEGGGAGASGKGGGKGRGKGGVVGPSGTAPGRVRPKVEQTQIQPTGGGSQPTFPYWMIPAGILGAVALYYGVKWYRRRKGGM